MMDFNAMGPDPVMDSPIEGFRAAMSKDGLSQPESIVPGEIVRFGPKGRFWYVFYPDGTPAGAFGDWQKGIKRSWCSVNRESLTTNERQALDSRMEQVKALRREEERKRHKEAATRDLKRYKEQCREVSPNHQYLKNKGVSIYPGMKQLGKALVLPVSDINGNLIALQYIGPDGTKHFSKSSQTKGGFFTIVGGQDIFIVEGYATGASVHEATGGTIIVAFNAGNLKLVAEVIRAEHPTAKITICADNDLFTVHNSGQINPGLLEARAAAGAIGAAVITPTFKDYKGKPTDFNDLATLEGVDAVKKH